MGAWFGEGIVRHVGAAVGRAVSGPPVAYEERVEADRFEPSRPVPHARSLNPAQLLLQIRRDFLGAFAASDYRPRTFAARVLGRQIVIVNAPEHVKHVLATRHDLYERKTPQMRRALERLMGDGLFISDGETWAARRPLVTDIVHKSRLPVFGPVMEAAAADLVARWRSVPAGVAVDLQAEMARLTAEIIAKAVFGRTLGAAQAAAVVGGFGLYQREIDMVNLGYFLGADEGCPVRRSATVRTATDAVTGVVDQVVADHLDGRGDHRSMVDALLKVQGRHGHQGLTVDAIRNEAATIFMAGYETTAGTLTWALYCLDKCAPARAAVEAEIAAVCGDRPPGIEDVPRLAVCQAVIDETLRLYPPVPILGRQAAGADRVGTVAVEAGALVLVVPWLLHRTEALWPEPNRFRPERFLEGRPLPYSYVPFAAGPRLCAGLAFGHAEATLCLASIVQRFRVRTAGGRRVDPICRLTLRPRDGLPATVEAR